MQQPHSQVRPRLPPARPRRSRSLRRKSRETILKREISDFSKTNPEIVAQIIKNMMKAE